MASQRGENRDYDKNVSENKHTDDAVDILIKPLNHHLHDDGLVSKLEDKKYTTQKRYLWI